jgi:hypothetical protein
MAEDVPQGPTARAGAPAGRQTLPATLSRYLLPLATAMLVGVCFVVYYLGYVQQHREYLLNRSYRVLATLGAQISETLANQSAILRSYADALDGSQFLESLGKRRLTTHKRSMGRPDEEWGVSNPAGQNKLREQIRLFAPRLKHIKFWNIPGRESPPKPGVVRSDGEWAIQLASIDSDGDREATATISLQDVSQSFSPSATDTFDDVLLANDDPEGAGLTLKPAEIVFQKQTVGMHFSSLRDLLKSGVQPNTKTAGAGQESNAEPHVGSTELKQVELGGVAYLLFLEPVTIDIIHDSTTGQQQATRHFIVAGLVPSRRFVWQSLAVSYGTIIWVSSVFLLLCLSTPFIKMLFFNERTRFRLWQIVLLPLLWVTMAGVLTSICLQAIYFDLQRDTTDDQLQTLSAKMAANIHTEIAAMHRQLINACGSQELKSDAQYPDLVVRTSVLDSMASDDVPYPYFTNIFWTDEYGNQRVKWSPGPNFTPLISVRRLDFFRNLDSNNRYFFLARKDSPRFDPFRFDSVLPPNHDNYVAILGMRASQCNGAETGNLKFAFLSAQPLSLIDPILPVGFGFALVDDTGMVLFHSDKYRNNRENILAETNNDRELLASIYGHLNARNFPVYYGGDEVRVRVVPIAGVTKAPWSLVVYREARYMHTYDLEVVTMAGTLFLCYLAIPTLMVCCFYLVVRPRSVPEWLFPSESGKRTYIFQIAAGLFMLALSAALIFLTDIEESIYAAAAAGYMTLIIIVWSNLAGRPRTLSRTIFFGMSCLAALLMVAIPLWLQWHASILPGLVLLPFALAVRASKRALRGRWLAKVSYVSAYNVRALVLLTVIGILPPLSFFRNSMLLEDQLHIRAAQLHVASAWNARERAIEKQDRSQQAPGDPIPRIALSQIAVDGKKRCDTEWDFYVGDYFKTKVTREPHPPDDSRAPTRRPTLDPWFLTIVHYLHLAFNDIGAEALGVLRNPALPDKVFQQDSKETSPESHAGREWKWEHSTTGCPRCPQLRLHQGSHAGSPCAKPDQVDLVVSSDLPDKPISTAANVWTCLLVITAVGLVFSAVARKIFLIRVHEPLSQTAKDLRETLQANGNVMVLTASRQDWSPDLAGPGGLRIDVQKLAAESGWAEKFNAGQEHAGDAADGPVIVENFDWELDYTECNRQRLILLERLAAGTRKVILVSTVDPAPFLVGQSGQYGVSGPGRWAAVLGGFRRVNLAHKPLWRKGTTIRKEARAVWKECRVRPEL